MIREIKTSQTVKYYEYWLIRGIHEENGRKTVVAEKEYNIEPNENVIVDFLLSKKGVVDFVSVEHNFSLVEVMDSPF